MQQKQQLFDLIQQIAITEDLKEKLRARVDLYPDQLGEKHLADFDQYLLELKTDEVTLIAALHEAADAIESAPQKIDEAYDVAMDEALLSIEKQTQKLEQLASVSN